MSGLTPLAILMVCATVGLAVLMAAVHWHRPLRRPQPVVTGLPIDDQPHTVTLLGANGRPNPQAYETFADYPSALARQRALYRNGQASVVTHVESGEVRIDMNNLFGPFRIHF